MVFLITTTGLLMADMCCIFSINCTYSKGIATTSFSLYDDGSAYVCVCVSSVAGFDSLVLNAT